MITKEKFPMRTIFFRDHGIVADDHTADRAARGVRAAGRNRYATRDGLPGVRAREGATDDGRLCGRSSMVEPQPSKLVMRVRFPSPALPVQWHFTNTYSPAKSRLKPPRAISGPLAHRHQDARRAVVIVPAALGFDMSVDAVGNDSVRAASISCRRSITLTRQAYREDGHD